MNEELDMELEIVELGDAKEETKAGKHGLVHEFDVLYPTRSDD